MNKVVLWILIGLIVVIILYFIYRKNFKKIVFGCVTLVTGAVKTGKSLLCVWLSQKKYKAVHRIWWIKTRIFRKDCEEPLYYTNVFTTFGHYNPMLPVTKRNRPHRLDKNIRLLEKEHLLRMKRFNYKSVIYIDESSLLADNMDFNNQVRNVLLSLFNKLIGHETRGGYLFYDTQSIDDNHYSIKRVISNYQYIQKSRNFFLFRVLYVREMISKELGENNFNDDIETTMRKVIIFRWWYHHYDRYYFSYLTDKLPSKSRKLKWYKGELNSFNPLYRKLSLVNKETRKFIKDTIDRIELDNKKKFERKGISVDEIKKIIGSEKI